MAMMDFIFWPFAFAFTGAMMIIWLVVIAFWVWMIIDCAQRHFKNNTEKIIWLVVIVFLTWVGSLVYFIVIKSINPHGIAQK